MDGVITTGVDDLLEYLKGKDKVPMQDAATVLGIPIDTLQAWVDFLVEEKLLGIEYKFTKPFIYLNKETPAKKSHLLEEKQVPLAEVKEAYFAHAKERKMPADAVEQLWREHVEDALVRKKDHFFEQAKRRHMPDAASLWERYQKDLLGRC